MVETCSLEQIGVRILEQARAAPFPSRQLHVISNASTVNVNLIITSPIASVTTDTKVITMIVDSTSSSCCLGVLCNETKDVIISITGGLETGGLEPTPTPYLPPMNCDLICDNGGECQFQNGEKRCQCPSGFHG